MYFRRFQFETLVLIIGLLCTVPLSASELIDSENLETDTLIVPHPIAGNIDFFPDQKVSDSRFATIVAVNELLLRLPYNLQIGLVLPFSTEKNGQPVKGWEVSFNDKDSGDQKFLVSINATDGSVIQFCYRIEGVFELDCTQRKKNDK